MKQHNNSVIFKGTTMEDKPLTEKQKKKLEEAKETLESVFRMVIKKAKGGTMYVTIDMEGI